jgi:hypothetical protein
VNVLNMVTGLMGTAGLNVPMFIVLRRLTFLFVMFFEVFLYRKVRVLL